MFVVAGGDAAPLLEAVEAALDDVPATIAFAVEGERSAGATGAASALVGVPASEGRSAVVAGFAGASAPDPVEAGVEHEVSTRAARARSRSYPVS